MICEKIFSLRAGQRISGKRFSGKRIGVALLAVIAIAGGLFLLWSACGPFVRPHFK